MEASSRYLNFCLYHGTRLEAGKKILREKIFLPSIGERHWLGKGVYFFEKEEDAKDWSLRYGSYIILEVDVVVQEKRFFDLINESHKTIFYEVMERLINEAKNRGVEISKTVKIDSSVIEFISNNLVPIDVIRARFFVENKVAKEYKAVYKISPTRIYEEQVQYCVRSDRCIKDIRKRMMHHD